MDTFSDLDQIITLTGNMVNAFSEIWTWLTTPIEDLLTQAGVLGILQELVIPDAIDQYSPIYFMIAGGLILYLTVQLVTWAANAAKLIAFVA